MIIEQPETPRFRFRVQLFGDERTEHLERDPVLRAVWNAAKNRTIFDEGKLRLSGWGVDHADGTRTFVLVSDNMRALSPEPHKPHFTNEHYESILFFDMQGQTCVGTGEMIRDLFRESKGKVALLDMKPTEIDCRDDARYKGLSLVERRGSIMQQFCTRVLPVPDIIRGGSSSAK